MPEAGPGDLVEVRPLGQVLPHQAVGVFIQASLRGVVRSGEVELSPQFAPQLDMLGKLSTIIRRERVDLVRRFIQRSQERPTDMRRIWPGRPCSP